MSQLPNWGYKTLKITRHIFRHPCKYLILILRIVQLSKDKIIGQSTFGMKETEGDEFEELQIVDASKAVNKVLRNLNNKNEVDLLHVNCEVKDISKISKQSLPLIQTNKESLI